jgi:type I restriction enzyme, S subunit
MEIQPSSNDGSANSEEPTPPGWVRVAISDTGEYVNGFPFGPQDWGTEGRQIIRIQNLTNPNAPFNRTHADVPESVVVRAGDILVSWSATLDSFVWRGETAVLNQHIFRVVPEARLVVPQFLFYLLKEAIREMKKTESLHGSTMKHINRGPFLAFHVSVAPLPEQRRIVAEIEKHFTRLEAAVAALKRVRANLKRYRASVLKAACEGRLVPTEAELARSENRPYEPAAELLGRILKQRRARWEADQLTKARAAGNPPKDDKWKAKYKEPARPDPSNLPALPEGWCWGTADQLCSQITDGEHIQPPYTESGFPLLTAKNIRDGVVEFEGAGLIGRENFERALARCAPQQEDILIVSVGATTGRAAIVGAQEPFAIVRSVLLLRPLVTRRFVLRWVQSPECQAWIKIASGSTAQAHFYIKDAKRMLVPLPPLAEQTRIVAEVERRLSVIDEMDGTVEADSKRAAGLRQAILKRAFEGKLVPQDPSDEPASVLWDVSAPSVASLRHR